MTNLKMSLDLLHLSFANYNSQALEEIHRSVSSDITESYTREPLTREPIASLVADRHFFCVCARIIKILRHSDGCMHVP